MDYVIGSGLLLAAVLVLAVGRIVLGCRPVEKDGEAFGLNEAFAFAFTVLVAVAVSMFARRAFDDASLASLAMLAGALAATAVAATGAWILLARQTGGAATAAGSELPAGPRAPQPGQRGRMAGRARRVAGTKRAA